MAQINKPDEYFNTVLYTGNGSTQSITGVGFQPDLVWWKSRGAAQDHQWYDVIRGVTKAIESNKTTAEYTQSNGLTSFNSDGFTVGDGTAGNASGDTFASWNWKAGGTASSNTDGSITSNVSANTTSGFSIVSYTGTGANATVGHGLGVAPKVVIIKSLSATYEWRSYFSPIGAGKYMVLNENYSEATASNFMNNTAPTSSVFSLGSGTTPNGSGTTYIAYCFADVQGFSKFGSYTGNGSADGTFVYTGFKPAFVIIKQTNFGNSWRMYDNKRSTFNVVTKELYPNTSDAEATTDKMDFVSNGFKFRTSATNANESGSPYIYMAFAENPLVGTNNIPATAR